MYHPASRRRQLLARVFVYAVMTITVLVIVTISIFIILGYSFNRQDGRIEQGGLLQFASQPSGAVVTLDGVTLGSHTPSKTTVDAKSHAVTFNLNGYRQWQKTITINPGNIGWLSYARMIPQDITPERLHDFKPGVASLASPDQKWIMTLADAQTPDMTLVDISSQTPKYTTLSLPTSLLTPNATAAPSDYTLEQWSHDSNRLLVKRTYDTDKVEWLLVDRTDSTADINLTTSSALAITRVQFGDNSGHTVYFQTSDDIVRAFHIDDRTLSGPLVQNTAEFSVYNQSTIVYVTKPDSVDGNQQHIGYRTSDMSVAQTIFSYPSDAAGVHAALSTYFGVDYIAITDGLKLAVYSGTLPHGTTLAKLQQIDMTPLSTPASALRVSDNGRFAEATVPTGYTTYDIELNKNDSTTFNRPAAVVRPVTWLDDFLSASDRGGELRVSEFDGANQQDIMPVVEGQAITLSSDGTYLYGFAPSTTGLDLVRAKLILGN